LQYRHLVDTQARAIISPDMLKALVAIVGAGNVISAEDELLVYECDAYTLEKIFPTSSSCRRTTQEVSQVAALCSQHQVPIIPRGAGTSLSGAVLA